MGIVFEWDSQKSRLNFKKHKVSFEEASTVFGDPLSFTINDPIHSQNEERFVTLGLSKKNRLVVVVHLDYDNRIRMISARLATIHERVSYEEGKEDF
jgi:uncharacterized protein